MRLEKFTSTVMWPKRVPMEQRGIEWKLLSFLFVFVCLLVFREKFVVCLFLNEEGENCGRPVTFFKSISENK